MMRLGSGRSGPKEDAEALAIDEIEGAMAAIAALCKNRRRFKRVNPSLE